MTKRTRESLNPKQQLHEYEIAKSSSNVKRCPSVRLTVRRVDVFRFTVAENKNCVVDILASDGVD